MQAPLTSDSGPVSVPEASIPPGSAPQESSGATAASAPPVPAAPPEPAPGRGARGAVPSASEPSPAAAPPAYGGVPDPASAAEGCPNCGAPAPDAYCPRCGQRQVLHIGLREWLAEFIDETLAVNARLPRTLGILVRSPGRLTEEWRAGRRTRYLAPFRLYLLCSLVLFTTILLARTVREHLAATPIQAAIRPEWGDLQEGWGGAAQAMAPTVLFLLVPLFAYAVGLLFRRRDAFYVDHLVFALHVHAFGFLALTVSLSVEWVPDPAGPWVQRPILLAAPIYLVLALRRVYGESLVRSAAKGGVVLVAYLLPLTVGILVAAELRFVNPLEARQDAHKLYWKWASAAESGDRKKADELHPEALLAYQRLEMHTFDTHHRYHLGSLLLAAGKLGRARRLAEEALLEDAAYLPALMLASRAAMQEGDTARARTYRSRFAAAYSDPEARLPATYEQELVRELTAFAWEAEPALAPPAPRP